MSVIQVAGIDLSLTSTGVACWASDGIGGVQRVQSKGAKDATLAQRQARLSALARRVCDLTGGMDLVVIEGPSLGQQRQAGTHDRSGLWWIVVDLLTSEYRTSVAEVPPAIRAKYATGRGNAGKDQVLAAVIRRYPGWDVTGNDVADALILAAMGARHLGCPIETRLPATHLAAMDGVKWPDTEGAART